MVILNHSPSKNEFNVPLHPMAIEKVKKLDEVPFFAVSISNGIVGGAQPRA